VRFPTSVICVAVRAFGAEQVQAERLDLGQHAVQRRWSAISTTAPEPAHLPVGIIVAIVG
jgi:hypothetical protein